jgi:predicted cobalt transporter CbtA
MLAGLVAGLLVFAFATIFGEPSVERAIGFERALDEARAQADAAHGLHPIAEPELVSRTVQAGIGLFTGIMVYATASGGLFALVFAVADRRLVDLRARAAAALLAAAWFVAVYVVPNLKYPASPPAIGEQDTIGQRTAWYLIMLAVSAGAMVAAAMLRKSLAVRLGGWNAALISGGLYLLIAAIAASVLPTVNEVPDSFPAIVLWQFRVASFGMQLLMWATIGLLFGALAERATARNGRSVF